MTMVPSSGDSPEDERRLKHNALTSAMVALQKLVKAWKEMAMRASPAALRNFSELGLIV
jgi:hypothetical protein